MLKALELIGFKSFADKTRFEFPSGITVVVGPNGSGKSNVVDAIKWVLGEQSVKSLRGKEMADVIFNGSGGRRAVNSAEATLTFDNAAGLLGVDTKEVQVTRRVYRSGEGEYLINRQPCRLRDIRDLFAGTGAATEAYSVIEQGKVDVLLQASPRDRRVIFEEAAGISRFKAKKLETIRRLERVDQNLLRLSDIVEEVENRLRSVRLQAGKARRYKEYSDRLQELRTQVGLTDWRKLSEQLAGLEEELARLGEQSAGASAAVESGEAEMLALEAQIAEIDVAARDRELRHSRNREQIAAVESNIRHQRSRHRDAEEDMARCRTQAAALTTRAGDLEAQLREVSTALEAARAAHGQLQAKVDTGQQQLADIGRQHQAVRQQAESAGGEQMEWLRQCASLGNRISALEAQRDGSQVTKQQRSEAIEQRCGERQQVRDALGDSRRSQAELSRAVQQLEQAKRESQAELEQTRQAATSKQKEQADLAGRRAGAVERASVLEELEKRHEGVSRGVKQVLLEAQGASSGPLKQVRGLVADLLQVSVEAAPLIEIALGQMAQHLVVERDDGLLEYLQEHAHQLDGRVGFLRMNYQPPTTPAHRVQLAGRAGVVGPATDFVETEPQFIPLIRRLLGHTWVVETLQQAMALAAGSGRGANFVTLTGEAVTADGTLVAGPRQSSIGIISRRSELRALRATIAELDTGLARLAEEIDQLEQQLSRQQEALQQASVDYQEKADQLGEQRLQTHATEQRLAELDAQLETLRAEFRAAETQHAGASEQLTAAREQLAAAEDSLQKAQAMLAASNEQLEQLDRQRRSVSQQVTEQQVELARSEQQLQGLQGQSDQLGRDQQERAVALAESRRSLQSCRDRMREAEEVILRESAEVAELYLRKEQLAAEVVGLVEQREVLKMQRSEVSGKIQKTRDQVRRLEEKTHQLELRSGELRHQRTTLSQRLREDYDIELSELEHEPTEEELHEREAVEEEIVSLRRKLANIGNVNLDALAELEDLEGRFGSLAAQYEDLSKAKASLEQIIAKINADSKRLFGETLETIRGHFQTLFRKLFGGGHADIVLDGNEDLLDCGIEIVGRPPGKEPRSISLLSGGEKTLTCVALLMAIFRSRPSPFCVLDEVDAALDEANIERFINVLSEFLAWTQFIVVTHSKKTMTCASTIYGVTMQESGISKRVSVRFEDVSEDGHIHQSALLREEKPPQDGAEDDSGNDETQAA